MLHLSISPSSDLRFAEGPFREKVPGLFLVMLLFLLSPAFAYPQPPRPQLPWWPDQSFRSAEYGLRGDVRSVRERLYAPGFPGGRGALGGTVWRHFDSLGRITLVRYESFDRTSISEVAYTWLGRYDVALSYTDSSTGWNRTSKDFAISRLFARYQIDSAGRLLQRLRYGEDRFDKDVVVACMYDTVRGVMQRMKLSRPEWRVDAPHVDIIPAHALRGSFPSGEYRCDISSGLLPDRMFRDTLMITACHREGYSREEYATPEEFIAYDSAGRIVEYRHYRYLLEPGVPSWWQYISYNAQGDEVSVRSAHTSDGDDLFEYRYDSRGNWVERRSYKRETFLLIPYWSRQDIIEREITYADE